MSAAIDSLDDDLYGSGGYLSAYELDSEQKSPMELAQWQSVPNLDKNKSNALGFILDYRPVKFAAGVF